MPIGGVHRAVIQALRYAQSLSDDVRAVYVDTDAATTERLQTNWATWGGGCRSWSWSRPTAR